MPNPEISDDAPPGNFAQAFNTQMRLHGDTLRSLLEAIDPSTARSRFYAAKQWKNGRALPRFGRSYRLLEKIERHYDLPQGYFEAILARPETPTQRAIRQANAGDQPALREHLPSDFDHRSEEEREEILTWIDGNVLTATTDYGKYTRRINPLKYSLRFHDVGLPKKVVRLEGNIVIHSPAVGAAGAYGVIDAPPRLTSELADLIRLKTAVLPPPKFRRYSRWGGATARLAVQRYSQLFGAFAAAPRSGANGMGVQLASLTFGMLIFPSVWDWYLGWRERRRGFFTFTEQDILYEIKSMSRDPTGWLRQHPELRKRLRPIRGLITLHDISVVQRNWEKANDKLFRYACDRIPEMLRAKRVHRDPFAPILAVLHADSPLGEYKKIADEIIRRMSVGRQGPIAHAVAVRTYLMLRLTIHLGVRQRNVRELLLCPPWQKPHTAHQLQDLCRGEVVWDGSEKQWEVFIPAVAFKNKGSNFFKGRPYKLLLRDLGRLYDWIEEYIHTHRPILLGKHTDPGTFFIKSSRYSDSTAEFDCCSFYAAWKQMIRVYGIHNPFTGRGAIKGLLPHGPHCVRDILATHVLKQTGSYELASFAIQDNVESTMRHYARFLPHEKTARAAEVLNEVWK